ncbi:MAG: nitroreductase family protein [Maricaulis sp.]|jgi:nitroreductase|nr:nitroreductase family protein [Maricaulis sp.]HAQ35649.1 nitroreductase family protein [Alphaproteobacteria bacterium]
MQVSDALRSRISTRAFLDRQVDEAAIRGILDTARWAPSGGNLQPWKVHVVTGDARQRVIDAVKSKLESDPFGDENAFPVYPEKLWEPYRSRRFEMGEQMYALLGIPREDKGARLEHLLRNFDFFGAPVGLFFVIEKAMNPNQWAHLGMFMLAVSLAAEEAGLATCMQEAWTRFSGTIGTALGLPETEQVYCGMALGYADPAAPVNQLRSQRADLSAISVFH